MLTEVADGVLVRQSEFCQSNAVVVCGADGVLLVDPGVDGADLAELVDDLATLGRRVSAGFATHPHWDHLLWHPALGEVSRYATRLCAQTARTQLGDARAKAARFARGAPAGLIGNVVAVPAGSGYVPWDGPAVRIIEHRAHAPGHAALVVEQARVLVAGDMLSDVEIPLLDLESGDPLGDYAAALALLGSVATSDAETVIPGHGSVASGDELRSRIEADRAYVQALYDGSDPADPRVGPAARYGRDWLPHEHERQFDWARGRAR